MPQFDKITFFNQLFWLFFFFFILYLFILFFLPKFSSILKIRQKMLKLFSFDTESFSLELKTIKINFIFLIQEYTFIFMNKFFDGIEWIKFYILKNKNIQLKKSWKNFNTFYLNKNLNFFIINNILNK